MHKFHSVFPCNYIPHPTYPTCPDNLKGQLVNDTGPDAINCNQLASNTGHNYKKLGGGGGGGGGGRGRGEEVII